MRPYRGDLEPKGTGSTIEIQPALVDMKLLTLN